MVVFISAANGYNPLAMDVYISANAFWALLISAIEVYKKECFGILLGYRDNNDIYIVEHAISYQTAQRKHTSVEKNRSAAKRIQKFLGNLPHLSLVGDFHSHTGWGDLKGVGNPSTQDVIDMASEHLYIIIVANDKRRSAPWQYTGDGALTGTVDDYHFRIAAHYLDDNMRARRANIFCPYAIGFSAKEIPPKVLVKGAGSSPRWLRSKA
jgi:proteasome lid subunit RPN8/RPN11